MDFGAATVVLRGPRFSLRFPWRPLLVTAAIWVVVAALAVVALGLGDLPLSPAEVLAALFGDDAGIAHTVVLEWRLPRVLGGVVFGAALGVAGAVFQSLTRNPLASPDIIGFSAGSYAGAVLVITLVGGGFLGVAAGALVGGLLSAVAVYLLAYQRGMHGFRLIVVGIGISAMLTAFSTFLILRAKLEVALLAATWGAGSLAPVGWAQAVPATIAVVLLLGALGALSRPLRQLELGDDAARALGIRVERARLALVFCGVALTAVVTAASGPIDFVSLAAPQIARRLTRTAGVGLAGAAATGALLLVASDIVAAHLLPKDLPVGLVTVVVGGLYLVWLLVHEARKRL
ncbi:iron chelate uptake ABC transporter family permease subunit [Herbiconiux sp. SALV-R1]|uniref:FecCD family ABC transporter permease n=1 Tax=unclassified Herbiconiux TaxID=2618217 RepID=UPI001492255A|nr:iron chelate uptake ABC transporter family permease subunit [Herbiconiux sp. SALV-R1]